MSRYEVLPVTGIGEVAEGADLADLIVAHAPTLIDGDIVVVTSKIVSKSEGRLQHGGERDAAIDVETVRVVAQRGATRIVVTRHGFVLAAAGVDASNVPPGYVLPLPVDPDASARRIRAGLHRRCGAGRRGGDRPTLGVIVSDTMGRPWRTGLTDVAIGVAGVSPLRDLRGQRDPYGNELAVTVTAVADEIAGAVELAAGKLDRVPVTVVRGLGSLVSPQDGPGAGALVRPIEEDMFFLGVREAAVLGAEAALRSTVPDGTDGVDVTGDDVHERAVAAADRALRAYVRSIRSPRRP